MNYLIFHHYIIQDILDTTFPSFHMNSYLGANLRNAFLKPFAKPFAKPFTTVTIAASSEEGVAPLGSLRKALRGRPCRRHCEKALRKGWQKICPKVWRNVYIFIYIYVYIYIYIYAINTHLYIIETHVCIHELYYPMAAGPTRHRAYVEQ